MKASIVIRTYNEARYLGQLLAAVAAQRISAIEIEVIVVDSGSTDETISIARSYGARTLAIAKQEFSFGRSLNQGCEAASGDFLVFISGHCVPVDAHWLAKLLHPLITGQVALTYGRQIGGSESKFSELQLFAKFFPGKSQVPQEGFFCNNANAALLKAVWQQYRFDEELTGLEDLSLGKRLDQDGLQIGYVAEAAVYHYHHENWSGVRRRYEREAIALQHIMPEIHISFMDFLRYFVSAVVLDLRALARARSPGWKARRIPEVLIFRLMQFWGSYRGNHEHRKLSQRRKELYFYPSNSNREREHRHEPWNRRSAAHESAQRARQREEFS